MIDCNRFNIRIWLDRNLPAERLQHIWATGVEIVDTFTEEALKSGRGGADWKRFFVLLSTSFALNEHLPIVPATRENTAELRDELRVLANRLHVTTLIEGWRKAVSVIGERIDADTAVILLWLDPKARQLWVRSFTSDRIGAADEEYYRSEKESEGTDVQIVRVSGDSALSLMHAYPNFYLHTEDFLKAVKSAIGNESLTSEQ